MKSKAYVRVTERVPIPLTDVVIEVIAGVELAAFLAVSKQYDVLRNVMQRALHRSTLRNYADDTLARAVESAITTAYPERSYFVEVGRGNDDEYVQVFAP